MGCISKHKYRSTIRSLIYFVFLFLCRESEIIITKRFIGEKKLEAECLIINVRNACSGKYVQNSFLNCQQLLGWNLPLIFVDSSTSCPLNKFVNCYVLTSIMLYFSVQRSVSIWNGVFSHILIYSLKNSSQNIRLKIY